MQICPFPFHAIRQAVDRYPNAQISWVQVCRVFFFVLQRWSNLHAPIAYVHLAGGTEESRRMVLCGAQVSEWRLRLRLQAAVAASVDTVDHRVRVSQAAESGAGFQPSLLPLPPLDAA